MERRLLSMAGRLTLINSNLSSTFIYHMSMYLLPKTTTDTLDKQRRTFFWQENGQKKISSYSMEGYLQK